MAKKSASQSSTVDMRKRGYVPRVFTMAVIAPTAAAHRVIRETEKAVRHAVNRTLADIYNTSMSAAAYPDFHLHDPVSAQDIMLAGPLAEAQERFRKIGTEEFEKIKKDQEAKEALRAFDKEAQKQPRKKVIRTGMLPPIFPSESWAKALSCDVFKQASGGKSQFYQYRDRFFQFYGEALRAAAARKLTLPRASSRVWDVVIGRLRGMYNAALGGRKVSQLTYRLNEGLGPLYVRAFGIPIMVSKDVCNAEFVMKSDEDIQLKLMFGPRGDEQRFITVLIAGLYERKGKLKTWTQRKNKHALEVVKSICRKEIEFRNVRLVSDATGKLRIEVPYWKKCEDASASTRSLHVNCEPREYRVRGVAVRDVLDVEVSDELNLIQKVDGYRKKRLNCNDLLGRLSDLNRRSGELTRRLHGARSAGDKGGIESLQRRLRDVTHMRTALARECNFRFANTVITIARAYGVGTLVLNVPACLVKRDGAAKLDEAAREIESGKKETEASEDQEAMEAAERERKERLRVQAQQLSLFGVPWQWGGLLSKIEQKAEEAGLKTERRPIEKIDDIVGQVAAS
jgi:hypothetical protein